MVHPEPIPSSFDLQSIPVRQSQFSSIHEVDNLILQILHDVSQEGRYTGPGCIQEELFRRFPAVFTFLRDIGRNPDTIPRLVEHRRHVQRVNTQLWAYATTHNVITLRDMEQLVQAELPDSFTLLGPIVSLPAVLEICQTRHLDNRVIEAFRRGHIPSRLCMTNEEVLELLYDCVCKNRFRLPGSLSGNSTSLWWESAFVHYLLLHMEVPGIPSTFTRDLAFTYNVSFLSPYGIRLNGLPALIKSVISMLRPESLAKANQIAETRINKEVRDLYQQFSDEFFDQASMSWWKHNPVKVLKHLAKCTTSLHSALTQWAASRGCVWPEGYLDSYLLFGEFVERVAQKGPFRCLLHLVVALANRGQPQFEQLVAQVCKFATADQHAPPVVVDLTDSPSTPVYPEETDDTDPYVNFLVDLVREFNTVLENSDGTDTVWQAMADLERRLIQSDTRPGSSTTSHHTLMQWLSEAAKESIPDLKWTLKPKGPKKEENLSSEDSTKPIHSTDTSSFDPDKICIFVRKLTWLRERSKEDVINLVSCELRIPRSEQLERVVSTTLVELTDRDASVREPVLYHEDIPSLDSVSVSRSSTSDRTNSRRQVSFSMEASIALINRDAVLALLATCPPLVDLNNWSQWSTSGLLLDRWGSLERFLSECGASKVCDRYNLVAIRLVSDSGGDCHGGGLLRFTASASLSDVDRLFCQWSDTRSLDAARAFCDLMIGCLLQINGLPISQTIQAVGKRLASQVPGTSNWLALGRDLQFCCPNALLGPLFSKFLVPCLDQVGLRSASSWSEDVPDIVIPEIGSDAVTYLDQLFRAPGLAKSDCSILISSVGTIGLQLRWPAFVRYFESHRLLAQSLGTAVSSCERADDESASRLDPSTVQTDRVVTVEVKPPADSTPPSAGLTKHASKQSTLESVIPCETDKRSIPVDRSSPTTCSSRRKFIQELRRREFGCGANLSMEAADLVRRMEGKLARSLVQLSEDLYGAPGHFLLELIQNADDNRYNLPHTNETRELPTLEFCAAIHTRSGTSVEPSSALLVMNNEAVGFTEMDIASLCDIGVSTKTEDRDSKTGRKGIGFKSVFNVTDAPEVHSNGFHLRFHRQSRESTRGPSSAETGPVSQLIPEWCNSSEPGSSQQSSGWPLPCPVPSWCTTLLVLPLTAKWNSPGLQLSSVIQLTRETLVPSVMLFLRRLRCLKFSCSSESITSDASDFRKTLLCLTRHSEQLSGNNKDHVTEVISVIEKEWNHAKPKNQETTTVHRWFCFRELVRADESRGFGYTPRNTEISIAVSLTDPEPMPKCSIFAYLPVRESAFSFFINADFDLTSSREDVDGTSAWNQWLVGQVPNVFAHMIEQALQLFDSPEPNLNSIELVTQLSRHQFIGRLLSCLPCLSDGPPGQAQSGTHVSGGLFYGLSAQLRQRLSRLAWLPVQECGSAATRNLVDHTGPSLATPDRMLLAPCEQDGDGSTGSSQSSRVLTRLLVERLGMHEPHPDLLAPPTRQLAQEQEAAEDVSANEGALLHAVEEVDARCSWLITRHRREALFWLGVQTISIDSLLDLASHLNPDEWRRPELLNVFLTSLELAISNHVTRPRESQSSHSTISAVRRRVLSALGHMCILPLVNRNVVRFTDNILHPLCCQQSVPILLPPSPSQLVNLIDLTYEDYIELLSTLGPLVDPCAVKSSIMRCSSVGVDLSSLLTQPNPEGFEMKIALPEIVFSEWISPALEQFQLQTDDGNGCSDAMVNWLVAVGQLYTSLICLTDCPSFTQVPHKLPLVIRDRAGRSHIAPSLNCLPGEQRDEPIFLPPTSFTIAVGTAPTTGSSDDLEMRLFEFLLAQLDDSDPIHLISVAYFTKPLSTDRHGCRWFQLFSEAGVCTLLSVHSVRYHVTAEQLTSDTMDLSCVPTAQYSALPSGHRLRSALLLALEAAGYTFDSQPQGDAREWIVEDFVSPGMELLLSLIGRLSDQHAAAESSYQLACLLYDNWNAFERVQQSWFATKSLPGTQSSKLRPSTTGGGVAIAPLQFDTTGSVSSLGPARWLVQLRTTRWFPVFESSEPNCVRLVSPEHDAPIYSPIAFNELRRWHDEEFHNLLQRVCRIWAPGPYVAQNPPPNSGFTKALQLAEKLERSTFESLVRLLPTLDHLADSDERSILTPDLMLKLYRAAGRCAPTAHSNGTDTSEYNFWLRSVFASSEYPCILVQCPNTSDMKQQSGDNVISVKRVRVDHPTPSTSTHSLDLICPICTEKRVHSKSVTSGSKRRSVESRSGSTGDCSNSPRYHLVKPDQVCWIRARLPELPTPEGESGIRELDEDDDEEESIDPHIDQCIFEPHFIPDNTSSVPKSVDQTGTRPYALNECYSGEHRSFFVDTLRIPLTSSLDEVLSLRPPAKPVSVSGDHPRWTHKRWCHFGRRLAQWYALLDYWLLLELENSGSPSSVVTRTKTSAAVDDQRTDRLMRSNDETNAALQTVFQFPLLFGADGRWHRPSDVLTLNRPGQSENGRQLPPKSSTHLGRCLFAWTKPQYADLVIHADSDSGTGLYTVLAHSLTLFDARHDPRFTSSMEPHDSLSRSLGERPLHRAHIEGTARGLLLDVIGLPVIDRVAMLTITPSDRHSSLSQTPSTIPHRPIPCTQLSEFWRTFCSLVRLWATSLPSSSTVVPLDTLGAFLVDHLTLKMSARDSLPITLSDSLRRFRLTRRCLACVLDSRLYVDSTLGADLFARLASLSVETTASVTFLAVGLMDDPDLMDSMSRMERSSTRSLYASLADSVCPLGGSDKIALKHFLRGFLNVIHSIAPDLHTNMGFGFSFSSTVVIQQLQNYLTSHGIRRSPALRLLRSICETKQPPTRPPLPRTSATTESGSEGHTTEHTTWAPVAQVESGPTKIRPLREPHLPTATGDGGGEPVSSAGQITQSEPEHNPPRPNTSTENVLSHDRTSSHSVRYPAGSSTRNDTLFGELTADEPVSSAGQITQSEPEHNPPRPNTSTENVLSHDRTSSHSVRYPAGSSTRNDTLFGELTAQSHFVRLPRQPVDGSRPGTASEPSRFWSSNEPISSDLSTRLTRMLSDRTEYDADNRSLGVGRLGELYVYHRLMELVRRHQERRSNFDEMVGLDFPTGHPILGSGRIVRCHWANADVESRRPFDLDIDVQIECDASQWDSLLERVSDEVANNVIRVARQPSVSEEDHCQPGLLSVGPIFLEVKSTAGANTADPTTDLFEISLSEVMCAAEHSWRYHLLRVMWERSPDGSPQLQVAPRITHIPDLATELRQHSPALKLCCAMLRANLR
ncbi:hypothetical protein D915_001883 [Fasciola hepatica]|uniref:Sacsin/Nov domain-containing protein n=1 Tax=Fasciola hepatica TaxID=6192 RepID=A0A4E0RWL1_FASHE|nr:hypothetical protein D915_001883 [Fasciola hepatica]